MKNSKKADDVHLIEKILEERKALLEEARRTLRVYEDSKKMVSKDVELKEPVSQRFWQLGVFLLVLPDPITDVMGAAMIGVASLADRFSSSNYGIRDVAFSYKQLLEEVERLKRELGSLRFRLDFI